MSLMSNPNYGIKTGNIKIGFLDFFNPKILREKLAIIHDNGRITGYYNAFTDFRDNIIKLIEKDKVGRKKRGKK